MASPVFRLDEGSEQHKFMMCEAEVAGMTGGVGNGKTAGGCVQALEVASQYRDARILVSRATSRKLEDSTKLELMKWCPKDWIAKLPTDRHNNLVLKETNSRIEFRHTRQEGKGKGEEQSNLLSATYDFIFVDQMDDPEFTFKDFMDLHGRLRGTAKYIGDNPRMPRVGPQRFRFTANPTRNWLFREVVGPFFTYQKTGIRTSKLLQHRDNGEVFVQVFNAGTRANIKNTGENFARRMESISRGSHRKRYVDGDWSAYEGLVYPEFDETKHVVEHKLLAEFIKKKLAKNELGVCEGYDFGSAVPSAYGLAFYDDDGNILIVDGFYEPNVLVSKQAKDIKRIRAKWGIIPSEPIYADPDIFRKKQISPDDAAEAIANMFQEQGIQMQPAANAIDTGIEKVSSYLACEDLHQNPVTGNYGAPRLYVSSEMEEWQNEIADYYWNKNTAGINVDKPRDINDHYMDMTKYLLTKRAKIIGVRTISARARTPLHPSAFLWHEAPDDPRGTILPRHM